MFLATYRRQFVMILLNLTFCFFLVWKREVCIPEPEKYMTEENLLSFEAERLRTHAEPFQFTIKKCMLTVMV
jgi:hypothetical protein